MNDGMTNDDLQEGWVRAPFSSVTVDPIQRVPEEKENIVYIDIGSVDRITKSVVEPQSMLGKNAPSRARKVIQTGDVLVSTVRPNLNAVALVESQYDGQFASTGFDVLRSPVMDSRWLFYSVRTPEFLDRMSELVQGALYPAVRSKDIRSFVIPIAPLAEQKRIADKLEAVLGRVDACRTRLDRVPALLKRFRQSVLAAATAGKLTEEWRMTNGVRDEWEKVRLKDAADSRLGKMLDKSKNQGIPTAYLRNINVRWFGFELSDVQELRIPASEAEELSIRDGDVLICEGGEPGRCAIWNGGKNNFVFQKALHRVRVKEGLLPQWLGYSVKDAADSGALAELFTGTTIKHLTGIALSRFEFPLPSLPEQQEIVRRVEDLFAFADRIEARLATAQKTVERLTPATLAKAFRGELVPQDPNDEPASALLARFSSQPAAKSSKAKHAKRS